MKSLHDAQRTFLAGILTHDARLLATATGIPALGSKADIYFDGYRARLLEVITLDFPNLRTLMGGAAYLALAQRYINEQLSRSRSLRWFGRGFPGFIRRQRIHYAQPWLTEVAQFEWALGEAFDAKDADVLDPMRLNKIDATVWPSLKFTIHPALRTLHLTWNAVEMVTAVMRNAPAPAPAANENDVVIWRQKYSVRHKLVDAEYRHALGYIHHGASFAELCSLLAQQHSPTIAAARAVELLRDWLGLGLITGLS